MSAKDLTLCIPDGPLPRDPRWPEVLAARGIVLEPDDSPARWTSRLRVGIAALAAAGGRQLDGLAVLSLFFPEGFSSAGLSEQDIWTRLLLDGRFERAALVAAQARMEIRDSAPARLLLVEALIALDRAEEGAAIAAGIAAISAAASAAAPLAEALLAFAAHDLEGAEGAARAALAIRPDQSQALALLARILAARGEHDDALGVLSDAANTAQAVNQIDLLRERFNLQRDLGLVEEAAATAAQREAAIEALAHQLATQLAELRTTAVRPRTAAPGPARPQRTVPRAASGGPAQVVSEWITPAAFDLEEEPEQHLSDALFSHFGYTRFRPGQAAVLRSVLIDAQDTLAVMPTGQGKSLCFQLPALLLPGVVLVVSPLLALMADQIAGLAEVEALAERSVALNSSLSLDELDRRLARVAQGAYKLVYVAPERLRQPPLLAALRRAGVSLLVVDEAHCTTIWGHNFRPDYLAIGDAAAALGNPRIMAVTATATPDMQEEIAVSLKRRLTLVSTGVLRDNLALSVEVHTDKDSKTAALLELTRRERGSGVVYATSRETCEQLARLLRQRGVKAAHYHAGLSPGERAATQEQFMTGAVRVLCATVAFGMGVNKRDIRFIVHFQPARSLEAYVQEAGRAGRDGAPARCVLLVTSSDRGTLTRHAREDLPEIETLRGLYTRLRRALREAPGQPIATEALTAEGDDDRALTNVRVGLSYLERAGFLTRGPDCPHAFTLLLRGMPPDGDPVGRTLDALGVTVERSTTVQVSTLSRALGVATGEVEAALLDWSAAGWISVKAGRRGLLLTLTDPAPPAAGALLQTLLDQVGDAALSRAEALRRYIDAQGCRNQVIARHFGETTPAQCGRCDRCLGVSMAAKPSARPTPQAAVSALEGRGIVLETMSNLPFSVGKTGLVRIVRGSPAASIGRDRCPQFGALAGWTASRVEATIADLVADGDLIQDNSGEYPRLVLARAIAG